MRVSEDTPTETLSGWGGLGRCVCLCLYVTGWRPPSLPDAGQRPDSHHRTVAHLVLGDACSCAPNRGQRADESPRWRSPAGSTVPRTLRV